MPEYNVEVTVRLELGACLTIKAKDSDAAQAKAEKMVEDGAFNIMNWTPNKRSAEAEWSEASNEAELDSVSEA